MSYGCYNRPEYRDSYVSGKTVVPFVMSRECQYATTDWGKSDPGCFGCCWLDRRLEIMITPRGSP